MALESVVRVVIWNFGYFSALLPFISFQKYPVHFHHFQEIVIWPHEKHVNLKIARYASNNCASQEGSNS